MLPDYILRNGLMNRGQFRDACQIEQAFPLEVRGARVWFLLVRVLVGSGEPEVVWLGLTFVDEANVEELMVPLEQSGLARLEEPERGYLCNVLAVPDRCLDIVRGILSGRTRPVAAGELAAECVVPGSESTVDPAAFVPLSVDRSERNNTSVRFGSSYILKVFRRPRKALTLILKPAASWQDVPTTTALPPWSDILSIVVMAASRSRWGYCTDTFPTRARRGG